MVATLAAGLGLVNAMVAPADLRGLVAISDVIVYARVDRWETVEGVRLPVLRVERTLKGPRQAEWALAVTSTFICDISGAAVGERGLFFLQPYRKGAEDTLPIPEPQFREKVAARGLGSLRRISHFGRGRMPVRLVDGREHVAYFKWGMTLPAELESVAIETPNKREPSWERSVPLPAMLDWVERYVAEEPGALTSPPPSQ